jgi:hypothetical protein
VLTAWAAASAAAGVLDGLDSNPSIFIPTPVVGFEELPMSPALAADLPSFANLTVDDSGPTQAVVSTDWTMDWTGLLSHATSVRQALWTTEELGEGSEPPRITTLKVVLAGGTGILALALVGLLVGFYATRQHTSRKRIVVQNR